MNVHTGLSSFVLRMVSSFKEQMTGRGQGHVVLRKK